MSLSSLPSEILRGIFGHLQRPLALDSSNWSLPRGWRSHQDAEVLRLNLRALRSLCLTSKYISETACLILYSYVVQPNSLSIPQFTKRIERSISEAEKHGRLHHFGTTIRLDLAGWEVPSAAEIVQILTPFSNLRALVLPPVRDDILFTQSSILEDALRQLQALRYLKLDLAACSALSALRFYESVRQLPVHHLGVSMSGMASLEPRRETPASLGIQSLWIGEISRANCDYMLAPVNMGILRCIRFRCDLANVGHVLAYLASLSLPELRILGVVIPRISPEAMDHSALLESFKPLHSMSGITHVELEGCNLGPSRTTTLFRCLPTSIQSLVWRDPCLGDLKVLTSLLEGSTFPTPHLRYLRVGHDGWPNFDMDASGLNWTAIDWEKVHKEMLDLEHACQRLAIRLEPKGLAAMFENVKVDKIWPVLRRTGIYPDISFSQFDD